MANLSAPYVPSIEVVSPYDFHSEFVVTSGDQIYQGSGVIMLAATGLLTYASNAGGSYTVGRAEQTILGDGVKTCRVRQGIFLYKNSGVNVLDLTDRYAPCYWENADTVGSLNTNLLAGIVWDVKTEGVYVLMGVGVRA